MNQTEFEFISFLKKRGGKLPSGILGIGDDCALVPKNEKSYYVIGTDALIENIHFDLRYFSYEAVGHKALAVNLSDVAAMGAVPRYAFLNLALPRRAKDKDVAAFYEGFDALAKTHDVHLLGGDTCSSPNYWFVSVTLIGEAPKTHIKKRSLAKPGDDIYVSGTLGDSALGLKYCRAWFPYDNVYTSTHLWPQPQVALGKMLGKRRGIHAMIDVSDGLVQDLGHIMEASDVCAHLDLERIPLRDNFIPSCQKQRLDPMHTALSGGEDYQLVFTAAPSVAKTIGKHCAEIGVQVSKIGSVLDRSASYRKNQTKSRVTVFDKNKKPISLAQSGFDHFS